MKQNLIGRCFTFFFFFFFFFNSLKQQHEQNHLLFQEILPFFFPSPSRSHPCRQGCRAVCRQLMMKSVRVVSLRETKFDRRVKTAACREHAVDLTPVYTASLSGTLDIISLALPPGLQSSVQATEAEVELHWRFTAATQNTLLALSPWTRRLQGGPWITNLT